jgi:hypothetical protein
VYLDAWRRLQEPSKVPCVEFPVTAATALRGEPFPADVRKCLWVADKVRVCK